MYPYVFISGPNKYGTLLDGLCQRNAKFDTSPSLYKLGLLYCISTTSVFEIALSFAISRASGAVPIRLWSVALNCTNKYCGKDLRAQQLDQ
jgi:hypothetical protein